MMKSVSRLNTLKYDEGLCVNCGMCSKVCPQCVFAEGDKKAIVAAPDDCMECGACSLNCPVDAISVDSGVGCASAMIKAALTGSKNVTCGCECDEEDIEDETEGSCCGGNN
jgi:NAD-dependent dihydropyrimidine dehydrogenase PreA subunit